MTDFHHERQNARLDMLEHRVTAILDHLGIADPVSATPTAVSAQVVELARGGRTIQAIRTHMKETGLDLANASAVVASIG